MIRGQAGLASGAELKPFIAEIFVAAAVEREQGPGRLTPTEAPPPANPVSLTPPRRSVLS
jgi:hypothetical protein